MSVNNGRISKPIGVAEVAQVLNAGECYDVGTLCTHPNINTNSLHKPISYPKIAELTEAEYQRSNYGYNAPTDLVGPNLMAKLANGDLDWLYNRPTGGASSPYRLSDFNGYDKNAVSPFGFTLVSDSIPKGNELRLEFPMGFEWLGRWQMFGATTVGGSQVPAQRFGYGISVIVPGVGVYPITVPADSDAAGQETMTIDPSKLFARIPDDTRFTVNTNYQCYLALTDWSPANGQQWYSASSLPLAHWYVLPGVPQTFRITAAVSPLANIRVSLTGTYTLGEETGVGEYRQASNISMRIEITAQSWPSTITSQNPAIVEVEAQVLNMSTHKAQIVTLKTISAYADKTVTVNSDYDPIYALLREKDDYLLTVSVRLSQNGASSSQREMGDYYLTCNPN